MDELCAMFDESSQCTIVLPEECFGYGLHLYRVISNLSRIDLVQFAPQNTQRR